MVNSYRITPILIQKGNRKEIDLATETRQNFDTKKHLEMEKIPTYHHSVSSVIIGLIDQRNLTVFKVLIVQYLNNWVLDHAFHRVHNNYFPRGSFGLNLLVDNKISGVNH